MAGKVLTEIRPYSLTLDDQAIRCYTYGMNLNRRGEVWESEHLKVS